LLKRGKGLSLVNQIITALLIAILLLTALWNGLVIRWYLTREAKYSRWWHAVGLAIRALLVVAVYLVAGWIWSLVALFVAGVLYNIIINLVMGQKWWYVGETSVIDRWVRGLLGRLF
jgi:hypothetical protein